MFFRILLITAIIVILFKLLRRLTQSGSKTELLPLVDPELPTDQDIGVFEIPVLITALKNTGRDESFAVLFPSKGDVFNLQFSIIDGTLGLDWVLINEINRRDRAKLKGLAQSYRYSLKRQRQNEVDFLRVTGGDLGALARLILTDLYSIGNEDKLHVLVNGFDWPQQDVS